jgi:hypothetical protein
VAFEEGDRPEILAEVRAITARYIPEAEVDDYVGQWWPDLKGLLHIRPAALRGWNRGY